MIKYVLIFILMYERQYVGGYGIPAIPTKPVGQSWQSRYGKDAIPSYRLPLIYKAKYELVLNSKILLSNFFKTF